MDGQPIFDVADELTEALSRQFIVLLGSAVFPLITGVASVVYFISYVFWNYPRYPVGRNQCGDCLTLPVRAVYLPGFT